MKKRTLVAGVTGLTIILLPIWIVVFFGIKLNHTFLWKYQADYEHYSDDFNCVKNFIEDAYSGEENKWLSVTVFYDKIKIYDPDVEKMLVLPDETSEALTQIYNFSFPDKDSKLDVIRIHGERISFCIENGQYALVYSPNEKPAWVNSPNEENEVKVKKIEDGWYHVTIKPN